MRLIINDKEFQLEKNEVFQTKQINTLFSLDVRQTNYTNQFKIPKTPTNIANFDFLGVVGNTSQVPYIRNKCMLLSDTGEAYVYNGWAVIDSTDEYFNVTIYDGNIDIYKAIENYKVSDIPLPELNHEKTMYNVTLSISDPTKKFRYMIADFGGKTYSNLGYVNMDYLTPFAKVKYIWDRIFEHFGFTYSGSVFYSSKWTDLWLSFPKGTYDTRPEYEEMEMVEGTCSIPVNGQANGFIAFTQANTTLGTVSRLSDVRYLINESGTYNFNFSAVITAIIFTNTRVKVYLVKGNIQNANDAVLNNDNLIYNGVVSDPELVSAEKSIQLEQGDIVSFVVVKNGARVLLGDCNITAIRINEAIINFNEVLIDFTIRDFFNEILWRFGITPYKDKFSNHYEFLTIEELTNKDNLIDWSDKFVSVNSESYIYSNYAQNNLFKYKYAAEGLTYYDGNISINNENLEAEKVAIQSKTFAPTKLENGSDIFEMYSREINNDGEVSYKNLSGRFYFATSSLVETNKHTNLHSDILQTGGSVRGYYVPTFRFQTGSYILNNYYGNISRILNQAKIYSANIRLDDIDMLHFDFKNPIHIKQLGANFLVNKINNYNPKNKVTNVELIKVDLFDKTNMKPPLFSTDRGSTLVDCISTESVIVSLDNVISVTDFSGVKPGAIIRLNDNTFRINLNEVPTSTTLMASVRDLNNNRVNTNLINIVR